MNPTKLAQQARQKAAEASDALEKTRIVAEILDAPRDPQNAVALRKDAREWFEFLVTNHPELQTIHPITTIDVYLLRTCAWSFDPDPSASPLDGMRIVDRIDFSKIDFTLTLSPRDVIEVHYLAGVVCASHGDLTRAFDFFGRTANLPVKESRASLTASRLQIEALRKHKQLATVLSKTPLVSSSSTVWRAEKSDREPVSREIKNKSTNATSSLGEISRKAKETKKIVDGLGRVYAVVSEHSLDDSQRNALNTVCDPVDGFYSLTTTTDADDLAAKLGETAERVRRVKRKIAQIE